MSTTAFLVGGRSDGQLLILREKVAYLAMAEGTGWVLPPGEADHATPSRYETVYYDRRELLAFNKTLAVYVDPRLSVHEFNDLLAKHLLSDTAKRLIV